eukprot:895269-Rhodomonas_salina.2
MGGKGYLYAVALDNGLIKVGRSKEDPRKRISTYNITSSIPLFPFKVVKVEHDVSAERKLIRSLRRFLYEGGSNRELFTCTREECKEGAAAPARPEGRRGRLASLLVLIEANGSRITT